MRKFSSFLPSAATGALVVAIGCVAAAPVGAATTQTHSVYQNSGAVCHGEDNVSDGMLIRTEQRLRNKSKRYTAYIICNLPADLWADYDGASSGQITNVTVWAKRYVNMGTTNDTVTCTLVTSFADDSASESKTKSGGPLPVAPTASQTYLQWLPADNSGVAFLEPANLNCALPPQAELDDFYIEWQYTPI